jgi:two-component system chemotaxis sensor kinase CheA
MRLATAAVPVFILGAGEERYALPRRLVEDVIELDPDADGVLIDVRGTLALVAADGVFPAGELRILMGSPARSLSPCPAPRVALKLRADSRSFALVVDALLEMPDISVRPLPGRLPDNPMFSGAAVLDDGSVVLLLDPAGLASALDLAKPAAARIQRPPEAPARLSSTSLVVFRSEGLRALPVSAVARILPIPPELRELAEGPGEIRIDDEPIPLIGPDGDPVALERALAPMALLLADGDDRLGLIVDEIVDVVEADANGDLAGRGAAKLRGERPEILDPAPFFARQRDRRRSAAAPSEVAAVLILEPAAFFRDMIATTLTRHGYRTLAVGDIGAASAAVETRRFAAVLLDVDMADAHDGEIARRLRDAAGGSPPAFIGLSSHGGPTMLARAGRAGLASAVGKFDRGRLLGALRSALSPTELAA